MKIADIEAKLRPYNGTVLQTKELLELGATRYHIDKLVSSGFLTKMYFGEYKVMINNKIDSLSMAFNKFKQAVIENNYEQADKYLLKCYNETDDEARINHMNIYKLLLNNLLEKSDKNQIVIEKAYLSKKLQDFSDLVKQTRFDDAAKTLDKIISEEKNKDKVISETTKLLRILILDCIKFFHEKINKLPMEVRIKKSNSYWNACEYYLKKGDYEKALENLILSTEYNDPKRAWKNNVLNNLLRTIIAVSKKELYLQEKNDVYEGTDIEIFNKAINNKDYIQAYHVIGKCVYYNNYEFFQIYHNLLIKINEYDRHNKRGLKKISQESFSETKKGQDQTKDLLIKLIKEHKYEEALETIHLFLQNNAHVPKEEIDRMFFIVRRMLTHYFNIKNISLSEATYVYDGPENNLFHRLFCAMRLGDYYYAQELLNTLLPNVYNKDEFNLYLMIVDEIIAKYELEMQKQALKKTVATYDNAMINLVYKSPKELSFEDIIELEKNIYNKMKYLEQDEMEVENYYLNIIEMIKLAQTGTISVDYFENFEMNCVTCENFVFHLHNGNYPECYKIINEEEWKKLMPKFSKTQLVILKFLLKELYQLLEKNSFRNEVEYEKIIPEETELHKFAALVKKRHYYEAFGYYLNHELLLSKEDETTVMGLLAYLLQVTKTGAHEIFDDFVASEKKLDFKEAKKNLHDYSDYLKQNFIDRDISYHERRLEILKKDITTPEFVQKEQLYKEAIISLCQKDFNKVILLMNEYIALDNDLNSKGYEMRAKAYNALRYYELSMADYQRVLDINETPQALAKLATWNYRCGNYELAKEYIDRFNAIRPYKSKMMYYYLSNIYQFMGDMENSKRCKKITERLKICDEHIKQKRREY